MPDGFLYLGHNQAPTSSDRNWAEHNCHPFISDNWVVAHNGVLTNFNNLKKSYIPDHPNVVDTSIIPALIKKYETEYGVCDTISKEVKCINKVLGMLEGTFGLWIINLNTFNAYIARQGSTLFYDYNSFSSTPGKDFAPLSEGILYRFTEKAMIPEEKFNVKSPFLEL